MCFHTPPEGRSQERPTHSRATEGAAFNWRARAEAAQATLEVGWLAAEWDGDVHAFT